MFSLIKSTLKIYFTHFWFYCKAISPILFAHVALPIIAHYAYFGRLTVVFSTTLGIALTILLFFIDIILIHSSYHHLTQPTIKLSVIQEYRNAGTIFFRYIGLVVFTGLITGSIPLLFQIALNYTTNTSLVVTLSKIVSVSWMASFVILFIFSFYVLIIEKYPLRRTIIKGANLFLFKPFLFTGKLIGSVLFFGMCLVILAAGTTSLLALITGETAFVFNSQLATIYSPWWQQLVMSVYAILGLPLLIIVTSILYRESQTSHSNLYEP